MKFRILVMCMLLLLVISIPAAAAAGSIKKTYNTCDQQTLSVIKRDIRGYYNLMQQGQITKETYGAKVGTALNYCRWVR